MDIIVMLILRFPRRYRIMKDSLSAYNVYSVQVWTGLRFVQVKHCYTRKAAEDYVINQRHAGDYYELTTRSFYD
jgi:hypothetical protein